jgi:hypothetical protein
LVIFHAKSDHGGKIAWSIVQILENPAKSLADFRGPDTRAKPAEAIGALDRDVNKVATPGTRQAPELVVTMVGFG